MGAHSSSAKIWGWAVTRRKCLNGSSIPVQGPAPDAKLAAMGPNRLASSVRPCFVETSPTVEKAVSCYRADQLVSSLLFPHIQMSDMYDIWLYPLQDWWKPVNKISNFMYTREIENFIFRPVSGV